MAFSVVGRGSTLPRRADESHSKSRTTIALTKDFKEAVRARMNRSARFRNIAIELLVFQMVSDRSPLDPKEAPSREGGY